MQRFFRLLLLALAMQTTTALADDGFSELASGGLVFAKSDAVSMDREVLEIAPNRITVSYEFRNNSSKDVSALVAFPLPPVKCGFWDRSRYPDRFETTVDGSPVKMDVEQKAVIRDEHEDLLGGRKPGQDVTPLLQEHGVPVDCRLLGPVDPKARHSHQTFNKAYNDAAKLGLALPEQPPSDPYEVYYQTQLKYYWTQLFPAGAVVHISHSYRPAYGESLMELPDSLSSSYQSGEAAYRKLYAAHPELAPYLKTADQRQSRGYLIVDFILKSANSWDGPIKDFTLVVKKAPAFIVTSLTGDIQTVDGSLIIKRNEFSPDEDLRVFYVGDPKTLDALGNAP